MLLQDLLNATVLGSIYLLFSMGMALTWGTIGILNFAHGAVFMFSAFVAHLMLKLLPLPGAVLIGLAAVTGALLSVLIQKLVFAPISKRAKNHRAAEIQILIGGIGVAAILVSIVEIATRNSAFSFGEAASLGPGTVEVAGLRIGSTVATVLALALILGAGLIWWMKKSRRGLALRAIGVNPETASLMGVNQSRLAVGTMAVGGALAGLAGAMLTLHLVALSPQSGDGFLIKAFAIIVLGGLGSMTGVVLGSFVLAFSETFVILYGSGSWASAVSFGLIFLFLLVRPQGILGKLEVRRT
ncbi:branched-chain amino acid ABC transporter permease [Arthrobacter sp. SD76]